MMVGRRADNGRPLSKFETELITAGFYRLLSSFGFRKHSLGRNAGVGLTRERPLVFCFSKIRIRAANRSSVLQLGRDIYESQKHDI